MHILNIKGKKIIIVLIILMAIISCKKYLAVKPDSKLTTLTTLSDLQAILDFTGDMNLQTTPSFGSASTDDYFLLESSYNALISSAQSIYTWNRTDYYFQNSWAKAYLAIYDANYCLDEIEKIPVTGQSILKWNNVKGSALFYRSYYFLGLLWDFAKAYDSSSSVSDPGIVLRLTPDFNVPSKRATVKECYEKVLQDAKSSISYLPDYSLNVLRPSRAAAYGLLARAYLSMRVYDSAYKYSGMCLQLNRSLIDYNGDGDINGSIDANIPFFRFNKETIFYTEMNTNDLINSASRAKIDTVLYDSYDSNDLRKVAFFRPSAGYSRFKCIYSESTSQYFTGIATDEIYLDRSESAFRTGKISEATDALNTLLGKRYKSGTYIPFTDLQGEEGLQIILKERRKELLMRGLRWIDIKRLNKEGGNIVLKREIGGQSYSLQPNANYYALPLPADVIKASGIAQNER